MVAQTNEIAKKIEVYIAKGSVEKALQLLLSYFRERSDKENANVVLVLLGELASLKKNNQMYGDNIQRERNRITVAILDMRDGLPQMSIGAHSTRIYKNARLLHNVPSRMKKGAVEECRIRLAPNERSILRHAPQKHKLEVIERVGDITKVELKSRNKGDFKIQLAGKPTRHIFLDSFTEWLFFITPLREGQHKLYLDVSFVVQNEQGESVWERAFSTDVEVLTDAAPQKTPFAEVIEFDASPLAFAKMPWWMELTFTYPLIVQLLFNILVIGTPGVIAFYMAKNYIFVDRRDLTIVPSVKNGKKEPPDRIDPIPTPETYLMVPYTKDTFTVNIRAISATPETNLYSTVVQAQKVASSLYVIPYYDTTRRRYSAQLGDSVYLADANAKKNKDTIKLLYFPAEYKTLCKLSIELPSNLRFPQLRYPNEKSILSVDSISEHYLIIQYKCNNFNINELRIIGIDPKGEPCHCSVDLHRSNLGGRVPLVVLNCGPKPTKIVFRLPHAATGTARIDTNYQFYQNIAFKNAKTIHFTVPQQGQFINVTASSNTCKYRAGGRADRAMINLLGVADCNRVAVKIKPNRILNKILELYRKDIEIHVRLNGQLQHIEEPSTSGAVKFEVPPGANVALLLKTKTNESIKICEFNVPKDGSSTYESECQCDDCELYFKLR